MVTEFIARLVEGLEDGKAGPVHNLQESVAVVDKHVVHLVQHGGGKQRADVAVGDRDGVLDGQLLEVGFELVTVEGIQHHIVEFLFPRFGVVDFLAVGGGLLLQPVLHAGETVKDLAHLGAHSLAVVVLSGFCCTLEFTECVSGLLQLCDVAFDFGSRVIADGVVKFLAQGGDGVLHALAHFCIILFHCSKIFRYRFS